MRRIVVTGAGGFLGRGLCRVLKTNGMDFVALDRLDGELTATLPQALRWAGRNGTCVHLAGMADAGACRDNSDAAFAANVTLTWTVLTAMEQAGVRRVVLPSTAHVYGEHAHSDLDESAPLRPRSVYAHTKALAEALVANWSLASGGQAVCARLSNLYGPGMTTRIVLGQMLAQLKSGEPVTLRDYSPVRDFLWLPDAARALCLLTQCGVEPGQTLALNVSSGKGTSVHDAVRLGLTLAGRLEEADKLPPAESPSSRLVLRNVLLAQLTGYTPPTELSQGLQSLLHGE